jgi:DNA-binding transcriptional regulator YiaG
MKTFRHKGQANALVPLHYTACGLDDVYLLNGFVRHSTPYGEGVSISHLDALHDAIALYLVTTRKALSPKEIRFLRKHMDMTQDDLGEQIGVTGQTVARYEKGESEIQGPADLAIRMVYVLHRCPSPAEAGRTMRRAVDAARKDAQRHLHSVFEADAENWHEVPAAVIAQMQLQGSKGCNC